MLSVNFILGKRVREPITPPHSKDKPRVYCEINPYAQVAEERKLHYHNSTKIFSFRTDRDDTQAVGKLYKGYIED